MKPSTRCDNTAIALGNAFRYQRGDDFRRFADMADNEPDGPVETGAEMDYAEHEKSYEIFLAVTKYTTLITVALLIAMAFGFFTAAGFISATILFLLICAVGAFFLR
jgi:hypothetical protein